MSNFEKVVAVLRKYVGTNRGPVLDNPNVWLVGTVLLAGVISVVGLVWALN
jgi:hypothetical protein